MEVRIPSLQLPASLRKLVAESFHVFRLAARMPVWVVAFSGGKDSSVLLDLALRFLEVNSHNVDILVVAYSDTLLDPIPLRNYALGILKSAEKLEVNGVRIQPLVATPLETGEDVVEMVVVRGYPAPSVRFRWCTDRWKIRPASVLFKRRVGVRPRSEVAVITGVRAEEAAHRARRVQPACICPAAVNESFGGTPFTPMVSWTARDVWAYIYSVEPYWKTPSWRILSEIYGGRETLRTGCWVCTLVNRDEGWEALASRGLVDPKLYQLMKTWRNLWLHMSREAPHLWRYPKTRIKTRTGKQWRYAYGKLRPEARLALALCLERVLEHPGYPRDAAGPLLEKLVEAIKGLNTATKRLCELLKMDQDTAKLLNACGADVRCNA